MKTVNEELTIILVLTKKDDEIDVECGAHYETTCEYGSLGKKGAPIELTSAQRTAAKNFAQQVINKVKEHEGIAG